MKRIKQAFLGVLTAFLFFSCANATNPAGTSSSSTTPATTFTVPVASSTDDGKCTGVCKGIIAYEGSGGDFNIEIKRTATPSLRAIGDYQATMNVRINSTVANVTGTIIYESSNALAVQFKWSQLANDYDVTIYLYNSGSTVSANITKLTVNSKTVSTSGIQIYKETSTAPVSVWVGTFSGSGGTSSIQGVFNYIVQSGSLKGAWARTGHDDDKQIL